MMVKSTRLLIFLYLINFNFLYAQNLVPNPSFETFTICPLGPSTLGTDVPPWSTPDTATPDYYNSCYTPILPILPSMDVPSNIQGYQNARTGVAYAGIISADNTFGFNVDYREYIQIQLTSPLVVGTNYCIEFYWSLADISPHFVQEIGVYLSSTQTNLMQSSTLPFTPQIEQTGTPLDDTTNWVLFQQQYVAAGGEEFLIIGNFRNPSNTTLGNTNLTCNVMSTPSPGGCFAYYYIDDVSVEAGICSVVCDATIDQAGPFCSNDPPVTLSAFTSGGTWSGLGITNASLGIFDPVVAGVGSHIITYTLSCGDVDNVLLTVIANPNPGTSGSITLCATDPSTDLFNSLGGTPDTGGSWLPAMNSGTGVYDPSVDAAGTYTYTVTNTCGTLTSDVLVTITANLDPGSNGSITLCSSDPSIDLFNQLGGTPDLGGTWSPILNSGTGFFDPAVDVSGTYTYSLIACGGGTLTADVIVNIDTLPIINAGTDMIVCDSFALTLSATGGQSYVWDNGIIDGVSFIQPIGSITYNVIGTDVNGCDNSDSVTITVNPQPTINISNDTSICVGQSVDLFADTNGLLVEQFTMTFDTPFSYSTINTSLPGSYYLVVSGTFTTTGMPHKRDGAYNYGNSPPTQNYEWKWNTQNPNTQSTWNNTYNSNHIYYFYFTGGSSQTFSFTENVNAPGYNSSWWNDNYGSLTFEIYYYGNILWSNGATTSINNVNPNQTTNYSVSIDYGNGCASSGDVLVTTISNPDPGTNGAITYCLNSNSTDLFTSLGGTPDSVGTWSPAMSSGTGIFDPSLDVAGTYTYSLPGCSGGFVSSDVVVTVNSTSIINSSSSICQGDSIFLGGSYQYIAGTYIDSLITINGCDSVITTSLSVLPLSDATITSDSVYCENDPTTILLANTSGGTWTGTGITSNIDGIFDPSNASPGTHQIIYTISGCSDADTINIVVNENPDISPAYGDDSCMLSVGFIDLNPTGGILPYNYYWSNGAITENLSQLVPDNYWVVITDSNGCAKSDTITIGDDLLNCSSDLWLPNIFSPNGDFLNDELIVRGAETASEFLFIIYNRWGEKVFESSNPNTGWDGTFNGKVMNDGVFAYMVNAIFMDGSEARINGTITLVK